MREKIKRLFRFDKSLFTLKSKDKRLNLFALLFPILFENVMLNLQGTVNTAVLSDYSDNAVAAVGVANSIISTLTLVGTVVSIGATVVISIAIGEGNERKTRELTFCALAVCASFALIASPLLVVLRRPILLALNLEGEILSLADTYFAIRMGFFIFSMLTSAIMALLRCYGYPKYTFSVHLLSNLINIALNIWVVYFPRYAPIKGVYGVAASVAISNAVGFAVSLYLMKRLKIKLSRPRSLKEIGRYSKSILKVGLPAGLSNMMYTLSQLITTSFVAIIGDFALSAKVYYMNILSYVYLFSSGAGNANALMVGRCLGEGDIERPERMNAQLIKITVPVNFLISLSVILLSGPLLGMFTSDELVFSMAIGIFFVDMIAELARAVSQVYEYALRAVGDIMFTTGVLAVSCAVFSLALAYVFAIPCGLGLMGCWIGLALDEVTRAIVTYFRWRRGIWKTKKV